MDENERYSCTSTVSFCRKWNPLTETWLHKRMRSRFWNGRSQIIISRMVKFDKMPMVPVWSCLVGYRKIMRDTPKTIVNLKFWWQGNFFFFRFLEFSKPYSCQENFLCKSSSFKMITFNFLIPHHQSPLMIIFIRENNSLHNFLWEPVINYQPSLMAQW